LPFCHVTLTAQKPRKPLPIVNTFGDHIRNRRRELGLFQWQLAERLGVDECTVSNWEKQRTEPQLYLIPRILGFLGYNPITSDPRTLGEKLLQYRKCRGISQKGLAHQIGVDPATLSRLERERGGCLGSVLKKVTAFLQTHT
jgi:transcriptional regulator with XRE-family HTH domain